MLWYVGSSLLCDSEKKNYEKYGFLFCSAFYRVNTCKILVCIIKSRNRFIKKQRRCVLKFYMNDG